VQPDISGRAEPSADLEVTACLEDAPADTAVAKSVDPPEYSSEVQPAISECPDPPADLEVTPNDIEVSLPIEVHSAALLWPPPPEPEPLELLPAPVLEESEGTTRYEGLSKLQTQRLQNEERLWRRLRRGQERVEAEIAVPQQALDIQTAAPEPEPALKPELVDAPPSPAPAPKVMRDMSRFDGLSITQQWKLLQQEYLEERKREKQERLEAEIAVPQQALDEQLPEPEPEPEAESLAITSEQGMADIELCPDRAQHVFEDDLWQTCEQCRAFVVRASHALAN
jgi:hypothetical protein